MFDAEKTVSFRKTYGTPVHEDNDGKKHYLVALTGMLLPEFAIGLWSRYVIDAGWAQVTWDTISHPWRRKIELDNDWMWTNFVLHPFQGSLYYMAARNSNLNRIEAMGVTALGDLMWEWFFETTDPALNDIVYSFFGGFAVGEMMYRLSLEAEQTHRAFGYILNPERIWTDNWTKQKPRGTIGNIYDVSITFHVGTMHTYTASEYVDKVDTTEHFPFFISPDINIIYNDPYGHDSNEPYSQFEFRFGIGLGKGSGIWRGLVEMEKYFMYDVFIFSNGMLFSRAPDFGENKDTSIGMVLDYDFRWHSFIDLAALSPGFAIKQRIKYEKSRVEWQMHLGWNMIGITDYYYYHRDYTRLTRNQRDYSYMTGVEAVFVWNWIASNGFKIENNIHAYFGRDLNIQRQIAQSVGWEYFGFYELNIEKSLSPRVRLGLGNTFYLKQAFYETWENVFQFVYSGGVYAKLQLK
ncbi:MAG: DUF3943 domain-containing protein [Treponema sp.]|nr:DUF3943 domain-containing protein [Treponema sp.]